MLWFLLFFSNWLVFGVFGIMNYVVEIFSILYFSIFPMFYLKCRVVFNIIWLNMLGCDSRRRLNHFFDPLPTKWARPLLVKTKTGD